MTRRYPTLYQGKPTERSKDKICERCHGPYRSRCKTSRFCSGSCVHSTGVTLHTRACSFCGKPLQREWFEGARSFCDVGCSNSYSNGASRTQNKPHPDAPFNYWRPSRLKKHAAETIEPARLKALFESQNGKCSVSGVALELPCSHGWDDRDVPSHARASLDRVDSKLGYAHGNIRFVSRTVNFAKSDGTDEDLFEFCRAVVFKDFVIPLRIRKDRPFRTTHRFLWTRHRVRSGALKILVTESDIEAVFTAQQQRCLVTGASLVAQHKNITRISKRWWRASVDRIDNSKGYLPDNIQIVSAIANVGRNTDSDYTSVIEMARCVCAHHGLTAFSI